MAYSIHPAAELFPLVEGDEFLALVADIKANGLIEPIAIQGNVVLDGRNRLRACEAADIAPHYKEVPLGTDPLRYITSKNVHRRHMTTAQRAAIAAELANLKVGNSALQPKGSNDPIGGTSIDEAAKMMNVSPKSVKRAKKVMRENPEAHKVAKQGNKPAKAAPATLVWTDAVERVLGDLRGISRNNLTQTKAGWKPAIEAQLGKAIPNRVVFPSAEASAIAEAFLRVLAAKRPADAAEDADARATEAKQLLPKTAQEKLDSAIRAAKRVLELEFEARVQERVTVLLEETFLPRYRIEHERYVKFNAAYKGALKREDYKRLLQFLHPDKHGDDMKEKAAALFDLVKSSEEVLCGPVTKPLSGAVPETVAELLARRRK